MTRKPLFFILSLALLLRLPGLNGSFWLDEAAQALESVRPLTQQLQIANDFQPPLFHLIVHFFSLFSHAEWWMRMPSLISGIATIGVFYLLLEKTFTRKVAMTASLLLTISPFHIFYSQELRPYALVTFFATLSWYILLSEHVGSRRWIWFTVISILGMYTMYLYPFVILSQLIYVFRERRPHLKSIFYSLFAVAFFFLPWLPSFLEQLRIGTALTSSLPGWGIAVGTPLMKAIPLTYAKFFVGQVPFASHPFLLISTAILLLGCATVFVLEFRNPKSRFLWYWAVLPVLLVWLCSFVIPVIQPKRLLFAMPAFFALLAVSPKKFARIVLVGALVLQSVSLWIYWSESGLQREDWRGLVTRIEKSAPDNSAVVFSFPESFAPWRWYSTNSVTSIATRTLLLDSHTDLSSVDSQLASATTVYLFDYLRDLSDPTHQLEQLLTEKGFAQDGLIDGKSIGFVRVFVRQI